LISEASHVVVTSSGQNYDFHSFFSSAREVAVLRMCHLLTCLMTQDGQCFTGCLSHAGLKCTPWCRSLNYLVDATDTISHRPRIDHHTYTPEVRVSTQQPRGPDEARGLTGTQRQKHGPQSPQKVANILTITVGLRGHSVPMWRHVDMPPCRQLHPCHLEKGR
jgi:hypothetical protein